MSWSDDTCCVDLWERTGVYGDKLDHWYKLVVGYLMVS